MADIVSLGLIAVFFLLALGFIALCDRLSKGAS